jgi:putative serine/threonine protein kinase
MQPSFIPLRKLSEEPYSSIIGYPKSTRTQQKSRIKELKKLGINSVSFHGELKLGTLNVLGKGYVGIVVLAKNKNKKVAVKIRRIDSSRKEMRSEARLLKIANGAGVGPVMIDSSKNFIVMEYLVGKKIGKWVKELKSNESVSKLKSILRKVLEDCFNLDQIGLDHGELSTLAKHVIVGKKTTIIDLESASSQRRVSNVTSATQGIFIGSGISKIVKKIYKIPPKSKIIKVLRIYKKNSTRKNFDLVLETLRL